VVKITRKYILFHITFQRMRCFLPATLLFYQKERAKNMGKGRAEPRTAYAVLYAPTTEGRRAQRGATERSECP